MEFKIGEKVKWHDSHYEIMKIHDNNKFVDLKQLFSIGTIIEKVEINNLKKV